MLAVFDRSEMFLGSEELEDSDENVTSQAALRVVWEWLT